jgi:predicted nucleotidyltransferase
MYSTDEIMQFANLVAEIVDPDRIILFGSYAYGKPDDKSDIDLLVVKNGKDFTIDDEAKIATDVFYRRRQLGIRTRCDVFYRTDKQVQESAKKGGAFVDALQKGRVIYERAHQ